VPQVRLRNESAERPRPQEETESAGTRSGLSRHPYAGGESIVGQGTEKTKDSPPKTPCPKKKKKATACTECSGWKRRMNGVGGRSRGPAGGQFKQVKIAAREDPCSPNSISVRGDNPTATLRPFRRSTKKRALWIKGKNRERGMCSAGSRQTTGNYIMQRTSNLLTLKSARPREREGSGRKRPGSQKNKGGTQKGVNQRMGLVSGNSRPVS